MIKPGLERIALLVDATKLPWRAIHVAGTNGKGSVCAYSASMLKSAGVRAGRFTSPHFLDRWDCISIDGRTIDHALFQRIEDEVRWRNSRRRLEASEFELLTATAFEVFVNQQVDVGVVEVGLGGSLDATNVLLNPLVTVITSISRDHTDLLGGTIEQIATAKGGIMKRGVPCFIDASNTSSVKATLQECAKSANAGRVHFIDSSTPDLKPLQEEEAWEHFAPYRQHNMSLAYMASQSALAQKGIEFDPKQAATAVTSTKWAGRAQMLNIAKLTGREADILLDGAHNPEAATALRKHVEGFLQSVDLLAADSAVTWVVATSKGKDVGEIAHSLFRTGDRVITVQFGPVDGMPWVAPVDAEDLRSQIQARMERAGVENMYIVSLPDLLSALKHATVIARDGPIVVAGSLYLVADVVRLLRSQEEGH